MNTSFKLSFEKGFSFYITLMVLLLIAIMGLLWAFVTCVHEGNFRKLLPGEQCDPDLKDQCGTGLVCTPHDETSHPFHHKPDPESNKTQYICQLPPELRLNKAICGEYCEECLPITSPTKREKLQFSKKEELTTLLLIVGIMIAIGIIVIFLFLRK